jgi:phosphomannomutase
MSSDKEKKKSPSDELLKSIELWLKWDQCETTRKEIEQLKVSSFFFKYFKINNFLKSQSKWDDLEARLSHRIQFGTAGLRAKMGSGFALMNELTVIQATQGLLRHIQSTFKDKKESLSVVIGFDARHHSHEFARLAAALFAHEQIHVYLFDSTTVPTPFIPFSIKKLGSQAGIMVTASHNPKDDNGYKVYWENGAQIISPVDAQIADSIEANLEPWKGKAWNLDILKDSKLVSDPIEKVEFFI